jgi:Holliday junction resolvase RusA-like endonuclease
MYIFQVHGIPPVQKQTRFSCKGGYPRTYDPSKKDKERIRWQIIPFAPEKPLEQAVELTIAFFLPIPKSATRLRRTQMINRVILPDVRPDEDNLAYIVTNALKGIVYDDDSRVCAKHVYKFYGQDPKTIIKVRPILQMEKVGLDEINL